MSQMYDLQKTNQPLKVLIVGAGTGDLSLAQGLKSDGISVQERLHSEGLSKVLAKFAFRLMNALPSFRSGR